MHTLARPLVREHRLHRQSSSRGFTLIELLTVIGIIAILAAITFGVVKGVQERAAISQARAELSSLVQALEAYKLQYGDYPQTGGAANVSNAATPAATDGPGILLNALAGKRGPSATTVAAINGKTLIDISRFTTQATTPLPEPTGTVSVANALIDPWGRRYLYYYKTGTSAQWTSGTYILLSTGPSVLTAGTPGFTVDSAGLMTVTDAATEADNIYANK